MYRIDNWAKKDALTQILIQ